jgi:hypothetical protein
MAKWACRLLLSVLLLQNACMRLEGGELLPSLPAEEKQLVVWAHSDMQPRSPAECEYYELAIADVRAHFDDISLAIVAGDLVHHGQSELVYRWIAELHRQTNVPRWLKIAGNHEWRNIELYKRYVETPLHYTFAWGNVVFLMLSNEAPGKRTFISDETFAWWKEQVVENQDKILITVTHAALKGSGLAAAGLGKLQIIDSPRFIRVLQEYTMDIWISGHSHLPGWLPRMHHRNDRLQGTFFIDLGAIRKDFLTGVESRFLYFEEGSDQLVLYYRNHQKQRFTRSVRIPLAHRFNHGSGKDEDR